VRSGWLDASVARIALVKTPAQIARPACPSPRTDPPN
jgi:hypothetical protein